MRIIIATFAGLFALWATSVQAAPLLLARAGLTGMAVSPPVELAAQGCGYGYRRTQWSEDAGKHIARTVFAITENPLILLRQ